jgi:hypothetical protein
LAVVAALVVVLRGADDPSPRAEPAVLPPGRPAAPGPDVAAARGRLAVGLSERNASLISAGPVEPSMAPWRDRVAALRPELYRLAVDWAQLQPSPDRPADLARAEDGCLRGEPPCDPYAGIRDVLRAVRSQQERSGGWEVLVSVYGVPDWAARPAGGCERSDAQPRSRPITAAGLEGYRRLVRDLVALGRAEGVELRWWSPWNEPNQQFFISPQRERCSTGSPSLAPEVYGRLVRALRAELAAAGGRHDLVLGELAGVRGPSPQATGIAEFVRALPDIDACAGTVWAQHAYVEAGSGDRSVAELRAALDERACTRGRPIWVTETGVGGAHAGERRDVSAAALRAGCVALSRQLRRWYAEDGVDAAFQYTYREDPQFAVGLADAALTRTYPAYGVWRAWGARPGPDAAAPETRAVCR